MTDNNDNNKALFERGSYKVVASFDDKDFPDGVYVVLNVDTGVAEYKDTMLPGAVSWAKRLAEYNPDIVESEAQEHRERVVFPH